MNVDVIEPGWTTVTVQEPDLTTVQTQSCFSPVAQIQVNLVDSDMSAIADYPRITTVSFDAASGFELSSPADGQVLVSIRDINPLYFSTLGDYRILTHYIEGGVQSVIRKTEFDNNLLKLTLASFTPQISVTGLPGNTLLWDQSCQGFAVSVRNPVDFPKKWISGLGKLVQISGRVSALVDFTAGAQTPSAAPAVNWVQEFTTTSTNISPAVTGIDGGSASADLVFNQTTNDITTQFDTPVRLEINWATPQTILTIPRLTGATFLQTYTSTTYTVNVSGLLYSNTAAINITPTNGSISNQSGSGVFTFNTPVHKDSVFTAYTLQIHTDFKRPSNVTGTEYTVFTESVVVMPQPLFVYPSLIVLTDGTAAPPGIADIVTGAQFVAGVRVLGDSTRTFSGYITNDATNPIAAWFAIRSTAAQPTTFKTGISPTLLNSVGVTSGSSVVLAPYPAAPLDYAPVTYKLYGITLQPGTTYVSIA